MSDAYDVLRGHLSKTTKRQNGDVEKGDDDYDDEILDPASEKAYRQACMAWVHLSAELVEECKADPKFRMWLHGGESCMED